MCPVLFLERNDGAGLGDYAEGKQIKMRIEERVLQGQNSLV